ncbi:MAG: hypothetical protein ABIO60_13860, partial [Aquaticitalea sp.]
MSIVLTSCKSDNKNGEDSNKPSTTIPSNNSSLSTATVPNGKRLTDGALTTYFPDTFLGMENSGSAKSKEIKNVDIPNNWMQQSYFQDGATST